MGAGAIEVVGGTDGATRVVVEAEGVMGLDGTAVGVTGLFVTTERATAAVRTEHPGNPTVTVASSTATSAKTLKPS